MVQRRRLILELAIVGVLALFVFPAASSALVQQYVVTLSDSGPSPAVLTMPAGYPLVFSNTDTLKHSVVFADGSCSVEVAAGGEAQCGGNFYPYVGEYGYAVDGTSKAELVVQAIRRTVSLRNTSTTLRPGSQLTLHGRLRDAQFPFPCDAGEPQPIVVIARPYAGHPFHRVAVVRATQPRSACDKLVWHVRIHPHSSMTYIAIASYQPHGGRVWQRARSKPLRVHVRR
jgi:hypothetical protein